MDDHDRPKEFPFEVPEPQLMEVPIEKAPEAPPPPFVPETLTSLPWPLKKGSGLPN